MWESHCFCQVIKLTDTKNDQSKIPVFPHYNLEINYHIP